MKKEKDWRGGRTEKTTSPLAIRPSTITLRESRNTRGKHTARARQTFI
jgi:hypothetical protein